LYREVVTHPPVCAGIRPVIAFYAEKKSYRMAGRVGAVLCARLGIYPG
jgi:hypothetical protein